MTEQLTLDQIAASLQATPNSLRHWLEAVPNEVSQWRPAPDEWCINEVIGHMIAADQNGFDGRIRMILAEDGQALQGWAINETAQNRRDHEKQVFTLLDELSNMRDQSAVLVRALHLEQLQRSGQHPAVGTLTVNDLLYEWLYHDHNHLKQILSNLQAYVWPQMGNAQKFSNPAMTPT